jgi:hypothetical protein
VARDASTEEIRRAYLRLARRHHPDYFGDATPDERAEAEWRMRVVNEAWAVLGDPQRRGALDGAEPRAFEPFTPPSADDEDPRQAPDVPYRPVPPPRGRDRAATLAPVLLFSISVVIGIVGSFMRLTALLAAAFVLFLLACVGFLLVPLMALSRARQDEG